MLQIEIFAEFAFTMHRYRSNSWLSILPPAKGLWNLFLKSTPDFNIILSVWVVTIQSRSQFAITESKLSFFVAKQVASEYIHLWDSMNLLPLPCSHSPILFYRNYHPSQYRIQAFEMYLLFTGTFNLWCLQKLRWNIESENSIRRSTIKPVIRHCKSKHRMDCCHLRQFRRWAGCDFTAVRFNIWKLMRVFALLESRIFKHVLIQLICQLNQYYSNRLGRGRTQKKESFF